MMACESSGCFPLWLLQIPHIIHSYTRDGRRKWSRFINNILFFYVCFFTPDGDKTISFKMLEPFFCIGFVQTPKRPLVRPFFSVCVAL